MHNHSLKDIVQGGRRRFVQCMRAVSGAALIVLNVVMMVSCAVKVV